MKKVFLLSAFLLVLSVSLFAGHLITTVIAGYTNSNLKDANSNLLDNFSYSYSSATSKSNTQLGSGMYIGVDGAYALSDSLNLNVRLEYVYIFEATSDFSDSGSDYHSSVIPAVIPLMIGLTYNIKTYRLVIGAGAFAGICNGLLDIQNTTTNSGISVTLPMSFGGYGFAGEGSVDIGYYLSDNLIVSLNGGYRYAYVGKMEASEDTTFPDGTVAIPKGSILDENNSNKSMTFDYSGIMLGIKATWLF